MIETILNILTIIGWLGIVLWILAIVNITTGTLINIWKNNEKFDWKKMMKGIIKTLAFFISSAFVAISFVILPFINEMINNTFNIELISYEILNTFSGIAILGIVVSTILIQAKKAIQGITELANISLNIENIAEENEDNKE